MAHCRRCPCRTRGRRGARKTLNLPSLSLAAMRRRMSLWEIPVQLGKTDPLRTTVRRCPHRTRFKVGRTVAGRTVAMRMPSCFAPLLDRPHARYPLPRKCQKVVRPKARRKTALCQHRPRLRCLVCLFRAQPHLLGLCRRGALVDWVIRLFFAAAKLLLVPLRFRRPCRLFRALVGKVRVELFHRV